MDKIVPVKVLLIDDHRLFNDGILVLLNAQPDIVVSGQVYDAKDISFALQRHNPDLVLLDLNLKGSSGVEIGRQILVTNPRTKVIILTMHDQPRLLDQARKAGFQGYLLKDASTVELLDAIHAVMTGHTHFDPRLAAQIPSPKDPFGNDFALQASLTFRELVVIRHIREGLTSEQIADKLHLSAFTVKTHRKNIYFKLGIGNVAELIDFANRNGL